MSNIWMLHVKGKTSDGVKTVFQQPVSDECLVWDDNGFIADLDPDFKPYLLKQWAEIVPIIDGVALAKYHLHDNGFLEFLEEERFDKNLLDLSQDMVY